MDRHIASSRGTALRQLFEDQHRIESRERGAADVAGHVDAAEAEFGGFSQRVDGEDLILIPLTSKWHHRRSRESASGVLHRALLLAEFEVHCGDR